MNYLIVESNTGRHIFLAEQPTEQECGGTANLVELHTLDDPNLWPSGGKRPEPCVGQKDSIYRVFRSPNECREAGFAPIDGEAVLANNWTEYVNGEFVRLP